MAQIVITDHPEIDHLMTFTNELKTTIKKIARLLPYNST